jgi:hypothetical protein
MPGQRRAGRTDHEAVRELERSGSAAAAVLTAAVMRASGHYGPRVEVAADADALPRVLAFHGRRAGY